MQRNTLRLLPVFALVALLAGLACKKVVQVDLNNAAPQIVIEGEVTNRTETYQVRITKTVDFSADNTYPPITGATVTITDSTTGHGADLTETSPGVYTTNVFTGVPRHIYNLLVIAEGKEYLFVSNSDNLGAV